MTDPAHAQSNQSALVWFRRDLRLHDNPAWAEATNLAHSLTALYVLDATLLDTAAPFRRNQLFGELAALDRQIQATTGGRLYLRRGNAAAIVPELAQQFDSVHWNSDVTPYATKRDDAIVARLQQTDTAVHTSWGTLHHPPGSVLTGKGTLSKVFTPFFKVWQRTDVAPWADAETSSVSVTADPGQIGVLDELRTDGPPIPAGEEAALNRLHDWLGRVDDYNNHRDFPAVEGTSMMSSDLRFGTVSTRHISEIIGDGSDGRRGFVRQLSWRDWWAHTLLGFPDLAKRSVRPEYDNIAWHNDPAEFDAWCNGTTGYPIVDAGMRQLNETGWMHNRVRMIVGSFLVKDLLIDWRWGERYFRKLLIDADIAQNAGNWQWVAGTGPDAAPYFRIFNPISQSRKFDAQGDYLRRWVPELAALDNKTIHEPWAAGPLDLAGAGVILGDTYPAPIIDHAFARERTLAAYKAVKS